MTDDIGQRISDALEHFVLEMMRQPQNERFQKVGPIVVDHRKACVLCAVSGRLRAIENAELKDEY